MLSLPISRRSSAYPPARSQLLTNSSTSVRGILRSVIILCSSVLWRLRVNGTGRRYSLRSIRTGILGSEPRWRSMRIMSVCRSLCRRHVKISQRLMACQPDITTHSPSSAAACPPVLEPMQADTNRLSHTDHARHLATGLCLYCGVPGHCIRVWPSHPMPNSEYPPIGACYLYPTTANGSTSHPYVISFQYPPSWTQDPLAISCH